MCVQIFSKVLGGQLSQRREGQRSLPPFFIVCVPCFFQGDSEGFPVLTPSEIHRSPPGFFLEIPGFDLLSRSDQIYVWSLVPAEIREAVTLLGINLVKYGVPRETRERRIVRQRTR